MKRKRLNTVCDNRCRLCRSEGWFLKDMSIRKACTFYNISKTTLQLWLKNLSISQKKDLEILKGMSNQKSNILE